MAKNGDHARRRAEAQAEQMHEAAARLVAERVAQGLPPTVTDPSVLGRLIGHAGEEGSGMRAGELNHVTLADRRSGISKEARFP